MFFFANLSVPTSRSPSLSPHFHRTKKPKVHSKKDGRRRMTRKEKEKEEIVIPLLHYYTVLLQNNILENRG